MKSSPAPKPRSDHAAELLRDRTLDGAIDPGTLIAESAMAREALFALERDGREWLPTMEVLA